jgi:acyl-[acyl carrier protein]--UDP-N-acetylglucosamine O-acyltransferase
MSATTIQALRRAYRLLFHGGRSRREGVGQVRARFGDVPEVERLLAFIADSRRGICR